jgi:iron complex transport system ATP-binding protein
VTILLEACDLVVRRGARLLVDSVDLTVAAGRLTVVIGPNGAGKSTLLRLISGELAPSAGTIDLLGEPLGAIPAWRLACMRAVMAQSTRLAFPFSVVDVVRLGVDGIGRGRPRAARDGIVRAALERADAAHLEGRLFQTLSGGEQQRVQFARVLAQLDAGRGLAPRQMLLLDEPVASLDLKHQLALMGEARRLAETGLGVVAVLHDIQLAADLADELVVLRDGRIAAAGAPGAVLGADLIESVFEVKLAARDLPRSPWERLAG